MKDFNNKNIYLTGGSMGIGLATAKIFANAGANVVIFARNEDKLKDAVVGIKEKKINDTQKLEYRKMDIANYDVVKQVLNETVESFGVPDLLINCAGRAIPNHFEDITIEQFNETLDINIKGCWHTCKVLLPHMKKKGGHIVNVSSIAGFLGLFGYTDYSASKFAVIGFSEALKSEVRKYNISVSILCPPDTDTPGFAIENKTKPDETKAVSANAKLMTPEDVAKEFVKGIQKKTYMIIPGFDGKFTYYSKRYMPGIVEWVVENDIKKAKKQKT